MKIAIHQIQYMPGPRFFNKMKNSDLFILLDDVQYEKREFQNRNKIRTKNGWQYLTIPVIVKGKGFQLIKDAEIDKTYNWQTEHLKAIKSNYARAVYFKRYITELEDFYSLDYSNLSNAALWSMDFLKLIFNIKTPVVFSSEFSVKSSSTQRLIDLCKKVGGTEYISGAGGKDYLDEDLFIKSGIKLSYQNFKYPFYKQVYDGFENNLSALDIILNCGPNSHKYI
ncbi:MAG: WbqC family protein [Elusimicrobia bacterium]|nr:WbqC family protein [Elusimicrobiota bacterium]